MGFFDKMTLKGNLKDLQRNAIKMTFPSHQKGCGTAFSKIGGVPNLPPDFEWPCFSIRRRGKDMTYPLAFIAQVNLEEVAGFDKENVLPKKGLLSFFYEVESQCSGLDLSEKTCAKVFYFEDVSSLVQRSLPDNMTEAGIIPEQSVSFNPFMDVPCWEEYSLFNDKEYDRDFYTQVRSDLIGDSTSGDFKLLGYADVIQDAMQRDCQLVFSGFDLANGPAKLSDEQKTKMQEDSKDWVLLFQAGTIAVDDFELMFGDMGRIYFYIRKQDLAECNFSNVQFMMQC